MLYLGAGWTMRGSAERQAKMLFGVTTEDFIPQSPQARG